MYGEVPCTLHPVSLIFQNSFGLYYSEICIFLFWKSFSFLKNSSVGKKSACNAGDPGLITGSGRSPGGGHGNPLQYSCLENPMGKEAWQATVPGVAKSQTQLSTVSPFNELSAWKVQQGRFGLAPWRHRWFTALLKAPLLCWALSALGWPPQGEHTKPSWAPPCCPPSTPLSLGRTH